MSDNFIPLNQSTPQRSWQHVRNQNQHQRFQSNRQHHGQRRGGHSHNNRWGNSPHSSFGSNSSNSFSQDKNNIDAYLHPSMLQDPWESLRKQHEMNNTET